MALLEGVRMGEGGGGGGPGREWVELEPQKSAELRGRARRRGGAARARGHPAAGCSDHGKCLENCELRCLYDAVLLEPWRKNGTSVVIMSFKAAPWKTKTQPNRFFKKMKKDPLCCVPFYDG